MVVKHALAIVLAALPAILGCGTGSDPAPSDPAVARARADTARATTSLNGYRGPGDGPRAQAPRPVVFVAADLTNGGIAGVAQGVQQATSAIGWPLRILDGQASVRGRTMAMRDALRMRPGGIILGGFDATEQRDALNDARSRGIPVVGWHAGARPGPDRRARLFANVTTDPDAVARLAARYVIADSRGTAGAVIFTDSEFDIAVDKARLIEAEIKKCRGCRVLDVIDTPIRTAQQRMPAITSSLLARFGPRFGYLVAINGAYIGGARAALVDAGKRGDEAPFGIAAGDGDASEFQRIRSSDYQKASVADALYLQGWQLIDELNRARAGQPPSEYIAPPRLITRDNVPNGGVFDPASGYRENYRRIWGR